MRLAVTLVALSGCHRLLGLEDLGQGATDATASMCPSEFQAIGASSYYYDSTPRMWNWHPGQPDQMGSQVNVRLFTDGLDNDYNIQHPALCECDAFAATDM